MKKLLFLVLLLSTFFGYAQYTLIPDVNFEKALINEGIDSGAPDGRVLTASVNTLTTLYVPSSSITDLTGIQDFLALTNLNCSYNRLSSLDVNKNMALTYLNCSYNQLTVLDVSKNIALTYLNCSYNQLTVLDVSKNNVMKSLNCGSNQLTNLDVSNNTALNDLSCYLNRLTNLDVIKNSSLTTLLCYSNQLTDLDVTKNVVLAFLECYFNQLTSINVTKNTALTTLFCWNNSLTSLDVTKNRVLTNLNFNSNQIASLDVTKNSLLLTLNCSSNNIQSLDIAKNLSLTSLHCWKNKITSLDVSKNTSLNYLVCYDNKLTSLDVSKNMALIYLDCKSNQISSLDITKNSALFSLDCGSNQITSLDVTANTALTFFNCGINSLTSLNLKNGNNTKLTNVDFTTNPNLKCIQVDNKSYAETNWATKKDATASYSEDCSKTAPPIAPPVITATGNQTYCPQTKIKIATSVTIQYDSAQPTTNAVYIQISSGYRSGEDVLSLSGSYPNIVANWINSEGKLILSNPSGGQVPYSDFETAIKNVEFYNSSPSASGTRNFSINLGIGQANFLPRNKHFYEYVPAIGITWTDASVAAATKTYYGLQGYLATLTAADEAQLAGEQAPGAGWIGGSDAATEGVWRWVTGPEGLANGGTGITFWNGLANGSTPNFAFWNAGEPNQSNGTQEDYAHVTAPGVGTPGSWNDLTNTGNSSGDYQPKGYIVEYGGMIPGDVDNLKISASTVITIPNITSTTPSSICGSGSVTLQATATDGIVNWYTSSTGGVSIATGNSFTTPILTTSKSYYVDASNGSCSLRTEIIATINPIPSITSTTPNSRCNSGTVTLGAVASVGTINWYDAPSGGTLLGTGTSFTTPNISASTPYYVEATSAGCTTLTRTPILATVTISPTITSTTPNSRCDSGTVTLEAVASAGTINWYDAPSGGSLLGTGTSFTTPNISAPTTYYVEATSAGCTTLTRTPVLATVNISPTITSTTPNSRCDSGTVNLGAVASAGTINWYDAVSGGNLLGTGTSFTTPNISATTTYYVEATAAGCTTLTRTPILATVNSTPSITSTIPNSRCDSGTVTLGALASAGTINWYDTLSGGTLLGTGTSFTTPNIIVSTTYYVEAASLGCSSPRLPVLATVFPIQKLSEEVVLCQNTTATLDASIPGMKYLWSPGGEISQTISVSSIGDYSVLISSPLANCDSKKDIKVIEYPKPIIKEIIVAENSITIQLENPQNYYEYAIDGRLFQDSNQFSYIPSGQHTAIVRDKKMCNIIPQDFTIFTIAKFFTPNNDGYNDVWEIKEMKNFPKSSASVFDRYGKLVATLTASKYWWDGRFINNLLPADDYWYRLKLDDSKPEIKGHFSLKR